MVCVAPNPLDVLIESYGLDACDLEALHDEVMARLVSPLLDRPARQQLLAVREAVEIALRVRL